tara:strand:- start:495 stop:1157 length:663 start_codon:yes stop_codon:yes gene_type:complete
MSQNDLVIANQTFPSFRSDLNNALQALGSLNSGSSSPSTTYANMMWYDTTANILKVRSEADDAWLNVGYLNQSTNEFSILDNTKVSNTSGGQTGLLGDQATSTWQTGTGTTQSLVSPANVKASVLANSVSLTTGSGTATIGSLKMAWGKHSAVLGGTVAITLPFSYSSTSSFGVVALSDDGNHPGATRGAQGVRISAVNQIVYAKAGFSGSYVHWHTIGY